ncbi:transmembrane protein C1orf162 homolog isoform X1 [Meles meles]|uniref:transmembrane protein C1orf162 homolog isoform X1 n=1 Tax=Meles meles TaxID=9662 RepID=UPI001E69D8E1|nr:transmembrane protein C1orf162 homolog isoform X1 [Meles meles]XP_045870502.1 transmembrane protein C1orf162 homolog isoform X1 [Meles meles]
MGGWSSKPEPKNDKPSVSTTAPTIASTPCSQEPTNIQHLVLTFFVGVLLTLLLLVLVFLIVKSYRKCEWSPRDGTALLAPTLRISLGHSSPWARDPPLDSHSSRDPPAKLSSPEEALTYASVAFKILEEKSEHLTEKHSAPSDTVVYAPVKGTDSTYLSNEA